ncbi:hypothetical protein AB4622_23525 [Vibrio splendidus]
MNDLPLDESFKEALFADDDLGSVIRVHLHIEHYVNEILSIIVPYSDDLKPLQLDYFGKVNLLSAMGYNPERLKVLLALGKMRNKFAHDLNYKLDSSNVDNLYETLDVKSKEILQNSHNKIRAKTEHLGVQKFKHLSAKDKFVLLAVVVKKMAERMKQEASEQTV